MAYKFTSGNQVNVLKLNNFLGVDLTNSKSEVDNFRSPDMVNLFMNEGGNLEKRFGIKGIRGFNSGAWDLNYKVIYLKSITVYKEDGTTVDVLIAQVQEAVGVTTLWWRVGTTWTQLGGSITPNLFTEKISLVQLDSKGIYQLILGGYTGAVYMLQLDFEITNTVTLINAYQSETWCYTPTTAIGRSPDGLTSNIYEQANLLSILRINTFLADGVSATYKVDLDGIQASSTKVWVKVAGAWVLKTQTTHYTVGATNTITFTAGNIPTIPTVAGEDNVKIEFRSVIPNPGSALVSNAHTYGTYGFSGVRDYIFLGGYTDGYTFPIGSEHFGKKQLPLYFGEFDFTVFSSNIKGYNNYGEYQTIHCQTRGNEPTVYLRSSSLDALGNVIFPVKAGVVGVGVASPYTFASLQDDPIWLSEYGVVGFDATNVNDQSFAKNRSYYINNELLGHADLSTAIGFVFQNKYFLCADSVIYVADARYKYSQKDSYSRSYQYEWFKWKLMAKDFPILSQCEAKGVCYIGTIGGVYAFKTEYDTNPYSDTELKDTNGATYTAWALATNYEWGNLRTYSAKTYMCKKSHLSSSLILPTNDLYWVESVSGQTPVVSYWTTPILNMGDISVKKTLKNLWVRIEKYTSTGIKIYYSTRGIIKEQYDGIFNFSDIDFSRLTFSTDTDPAVVVTNRSERKFMSIQFKVESDDGNPFGLLEIVAKYTVNNQFKG